MEEQNQSTKAVSNCQKLETTLEVLKIDYEKLWVALIGSVGGLGTILLKGIYSWITVITALLIIGEVIGLILTRVKLFKVAQDLKSCKEFINIPKFNQ